jgi:hypothetical protein
LRNKCNNYLKRLALPDIKDGSIIEVSYVVNSDFTSYPKPWSFQHPYPIIWSEYRFAYPQYFYYALNQEGYNRLAVNENNRSSKTVVFNNGSNETSGEQKTRRSEVIASTMAYTDIDMIEWQLPEGYTLEHTPEPVKFQSRFGEYEATVKTEGTKMIYTRRMVVNDKAHPSDTLTELMDFYKNIEKSDKAKVVLVSK